MKHVISILLLLLLLTGCAVQAANLPEPSSAPETAERLAPSAATEPPTPETVATEAPAPETTEADAGLTGTVMCLSRDLVASPGAPCPVLTVSFPEVDLSGAPEGRVCELSVLVDGEPVGEWEALRLQPGLTRKLLLEFSFARYAPDRRALVSATLRYGDESLTEETEVLLRNDPDEVYALASGDPKPYSIDVLRNQNLVIVYGKDETGAYTVPVKTFLCSTGWATPTGTYRVGAKREWGRLFGGVYGQYISGIVGDILFHSVPYHRMDKGSLETEEFNKLGTAASMGCVRLAVGDVKWIYDFCPTGTAVHIFNTQELPVERPEAPWLDPEDPRSGWDPTDPDPENPWKESTDD